MINYSEQYKDPRWQKKRLEIMDRDGFQCTSCGDKTSQLSVHHKSPYEKNKNLWEYKDENLITLCSDCHEQITSYLHDSRIMIMDISDGVEKADILCNILAMMTQMSMSQILDVYDFVKKV